MNKTSILLSNNPQAENSRNLPVQNFQKSAEVQKTRLVQFFSVAGLEILAAFPGWSSLGVSGLEIPAAFPGWRFPPRSWTGKIPVPLPFIETGLEFPGLGLISSSPVSNGKGTGIC